MRWKSSRSQSSLPEEPLDEAALAKLKHRHEAQQLVKKIAELKGPLTADTEQMLQQKFEQAIAASERNKK